MVVQLQAKGTAPGSIAQQIARMDAGRLRAYRENLEFYQGRQWADSPRRRERRLTLNYAKTVIEKTASYTMSGLSFVADPEDGSAEAAARARRAERALRENPRGEQPRPARVRQLDRLLGARQRGVQGDLGPRGEASADLRAGRAGALGLAVGR